MSRESSSLEHGCGNGSVQHMTGHTMMMMDGGAGLDTTALVQSRTNSAGTKLTLILLHQAATLQVLN